MPDPVAAPLPGKPPSPGRSVLRLAVERTAFIAAIVAVVAVLVS